MKKTYFIGDIISTTGPAIVNKSYYTHLKNEMVFCPTNNKTLRTIHYLIHILSVNAIIVSGYSKLNVLLLKIASKLNKKTFYLMHGFINEEMKYTNNENKEEKIQKEYELLSTVDKIICVSEKFAHYLEKVYLEFKDKITYLNNGIDINTNKSKVTNNQFTIITVGGGRKQKNNLKICEAIKKAKLNVKLIVIGGIFEEGKKIQEYSFVEYYESLSHDEVLNKMCEANLYIQNSYFETFGLAVAEALECGCNILISENMGILSILENVRDKDMINNVEDIEEIINKIKAKMLEDNCNITYNKKVCSIQNRSAEMLKIIN